MSGGVVLTEAMPPEMFTAVWNVYTASGSQFDATKDALWHEVQGLIQAARAAQAGRVAEVVEKVLREAGLKPIITAALAAQVAAELEADHG